MQLFTKVVPKELTNIFEDFESTICSVIHYSEEECYDFQNNKVITGNFIDFFHEHNTIENNFHYYINLLVKLLLEQMKKYSSSEIVPFFELQKIYSLEFNPVKRKKKIYDQYLIVNIASGDDTILNSNYKLNEYEKDLIQLVYDKYTDAYEKLTEQVNRLYVSFNSPPEQSEKQKSDESDLSEKIKKHFGFMLGNCPRKGVPILNNQKDFDSLVKWTTSYFENNFEVPEILEPIKSVTTNYFLTQLAFIYLFDELRKKGFHSQRSRAQTLFTLWESCFLDYKGYSEKNFWKVKHEKREEVKKLMQIDYKN